MLFDSNSRISGSKLRFAMSLRRNLREFLSESGNRIFCVLSRHSSSSCRGRIPLEGIDQRTNLSSFRLVLTFQHCTNRNEAYLYLAMASLWIGGAL